MLADSSIPWEAVTHKHASTSNYRELELNPALVSFHIGVGLCMP